MTYAGLRDAHIARVGQIGGPDASISQGLPVEILARPVFEEEGERHMLIVDDPLLEQYMSSSGLSSIGGKAERASA